MASSLLCVGHWVKSSPFTLPEDVGCSVLCWPTSQHKDAPLLGISQPPTQHQPNARNLLGLPLFIVNKQRRELD